MAQMHMYLKNINDNQIFAALSLVLSNEKKYQNDMEAKYQENTL